MSTPYTNIKVDVSVVPNELVGEFIRRHVKKEGTYLAIGDATGEMCETLSYRGWKGIRVGTDIPKESFPGEKYIFAYMAADPRIARILEGYYVRTLTVSEIFNQFPGPYDVIAAVGSEMDRDIWVHENVLNHGPRIYVLSEDGHNEQVIKIGKTKGYESFLLEDNLVMVRGE